MLMKTIALIARLCKWNTL